MDLQRRHLIRSLAVLALGVLLGTAGPAGALSVGGTTVSVPTTTVPTVTLPPTPAVQLPTSTLPSTSLPSTPTKTQPPSTPKLPSATDPVTTRLPSSTGPLAPKLSPEPPSTGTLPTGLGSETPSTSGSGVASGSNLGSSSARITGALTGGLVGGQGGGPAGGPAGGPSAGPGSGPIATGPGGTSAGGGPGLAPLLLAMETGNGPASLRSQAFQALRSEIAQLTPCFGVLAPLERRLVALRFGLGGRAPLSLRGVARALGISTGAARRAELQALGRLDGAARTGCAGAGVSSASYVFDPSTVGDLLAAKLGAGSTLAAGSSSSGAVRGGPARASAGALPHSWPSADSTGFFRTALIALILVGSLLLLGGLALAGARPPMPAPAGTANGRRRTVARSSQRRTTRHSPAQARPARRPGHARVASVRRSSIQDR
jgi:hypothetical protein